MLIDEQPETIDCGPEFDERIEAVADKPAVFLIRVRDGAPYLARTNLLRRRLRRLLAGREQPSRLLNLRGVAERVEYWRFASRLESSLLLHELARRHLPSGYERIVKLRPPSLVRLVRNNPYPRTTVTTRISPGDSTYYGPFPSRASAEMFEAGFLDFFQLRRCQEDLEPSGAHPGCVYGEMNKCLRPCQLAVTPEEYASEAQRVAAFLNSRGQTLLDTLTRARDRYAAELEFEEAARLHKRLEKAAAAIGACDPLVTGLDALSGVAVTPSTAPNSVCLWFYWKGRWHPRQVLSLDLVDGRPQPLDRRVKELAAGLAPASRCSAREQQEHLALLSSWYYSSWRDGEWVGFPGLDAIPYRKVVNAIHRVSRAAAQA